MIPNHFWLDLNIVWSPSDCTHHGRHNSWLFSLPAKCVIGTPERHTKQWYLGRFTSLFEELQWQIAFVRITALCSMICHRNCSNSTSSFNDIRKGKLITSRCVKECHCADKCISSTLTKKNRINYYSTYITSGRGLWIVIILWAEEMLSWWS